MGYQMEAQQCPSMNPVANVQVCNGSMTPAVNFTSTEPNVAYTWTNSNPSIGLAANGTGNIPAFTAGNSGTTPIVGTISVTPKTQVSQTFNYTGAVQTFVVPSGVTALKFDVKGSQGGSAIYNTATKPDDVGGKGGRVTADYPVTPGETLYIYVGGTTFNGGGIGGGTIAQPNGGGASDVRRGGTALTNRIIVAGGGGGGGNNCSANAEPGGAGGGLIGQVGWQCGSQTSTSVGQGGTQSSGGVAGTSPSTPGQLGIGGNAGGTGTASGGGGGGYYGGGGAAFGGGGGGSSYTGLEATNVEHMQGYQEGVGQIVISYGVDCVGATTTTFTYTVNPSSAAPTGIAVQNVSAGSTLASLVVVGQNIKWYATAADAAIHVNPLPLTTPLVNNTTYYATQTAGGCESVASLAVTATLQGLSVDEANTNNGIKIYPNPVDDVLNIIAASKIKKVVVTSLEGRLVMEEQSVSESMLNVGKLEKGVYVLTIFTNSGKEVIKFIKK